MTSNLRMNEFTCKLPGNTPRSEDPHLSESGILKAYRLEPQF